MDIPPGKFRIGDKEDVYLYGSYDVKKIPNEIEVPYEVDSNIECQLIYDVGKVLYRADTDGIFDLIDLFIRYSHDPCTDVDLDFSIKEEERMMWGTICPTKKVLFAHRGKVFVAFGRYIFGYDKYGCEVMKRVEPIESTTVGSHAVGTGSSHDGDAEEEKEDLLDIDQIVLWGPPDDERSNPRGDCYYSFMIYDKETSILDAFGLYW